LPVYDHESSCQVSFPNSPGRGTVWNVHLSLPVRTSQPRVYPGICSLMLLNDEIEAGVITVSFTTTGGDCTE
jgi:hypothetical protein